MDSSWSRLESTLIRVEKGLSFLGLLCAGLALVASLVMVVIGVVARYLLKVGVVFVDEYVGYALVVMAFMALAPALTADKHIRVTSAVSLLSQKVQAWLFVATTAVALAITLFICVQTWDRAMTSYRVGALSVSPLETPLFVPQMFIPVGFAFLGVSLAAYLCRLIRLAMKRPA